jgi:hypothetical protein
MSGVARQTNGIDRRTSPRTAFGKPVVRIEVAGREPIMACVVDISESGACLLFATNIHVPDVFKITFDNVSRRARVMWRKESFVGVKFLDAI